MEAAGLYVAANAQDLSTIYLGFFFYGLGLGGAQVLEEVMWADYFGRVSLGTVRGAALQIVLLCGVCGPPFFGFVNRLHRVLHGSRFYIFIGHAADLVGMLTLTIRRPRHPGAPEPARIDCPAGTVSMRTTPQDPGFSTAGTSSPPAFVVQVACAFYLSSTLGVHAQGDYRRDGSLPGLRSR